MNLDILKNRPLMIGVGVAAAAGLFVLVRRKQTTGTTATGTTTTGTTTAGTLDTTGTDIASWMGDYSKSLQDQLDAYTKTLQDTISSLKTTTPSGTDTTTTTPQQVNEPKYQGVNAGWTVNQWIRDLQKGYGDQGGNPAASWDLILQLNPDIRSNITGQVGNNTELNFFMKPKTYRIA